MDQLNPAKVQQVSDQEKMKQMEREIKELKRANKFYVKQRLFSPRRSSTDLTNNGGFYPLLLMCSHEQLLDGKYLHG